jgi:hypothetical protein
LTDLLTILGFMEASSGGSERCSKDGGELIGFATQLFDFISGSQLKVDKQRQPALTLVGFLSDDAYFGGELCPTTRLARRPVIGVNGCGRVD